MDIEQARDIIDRLPTQSGLVEIVYRGGDKNRRTMPGYVGVLDIFAMPPEGIPPEYRDRYGEGKEHPLPPFLTVRRELDRNRVPIEPMDIPLADIEDIMPAAIVELKEKPEAEGTSP